MIFNNLHKQHKCNNRLTNNSINNCLSRKRMVVTKDRPHGPGCSVPMFNVVECEDHSAIQAPLKQGFYRLVSFTNLLLKGKYHCTADLLFCRFEFNQTSKSIDQTLNSKSIDNFNKIKLLNPNLPEKGQV